MAFDQTLTTSFKQEILLGVHDLETDEIKIALYLATADLGAATTVYSSASEVSDTDTGYTAGGNILTGVTVLTSGTTAYVDFADSTWDPADFTARGALIYNATKDNKAIAVLDFGSDKTTTTIFTVQMPANSATSALIRIA